MVSKINGLFERTKKKFFAKSAGKGEVNVFHPDWDSFFRCNGDKLFNRLKGLEDTKSTAGDITTAIIQCSVFV